MSYERSDVHVGGIVRFAAGLAAGLIVSLLLMRGLLAFFEARGRAEQGPAPVGQLAAEAPRPPEPVLQGAPGSRYPLADPALEMEALRREQRDALEHGALPIEEAKRRVLEAGLPVRAAAGSAP